MVKRCPVCNAREHVYADFGMGVHEVSEDMLKDYKGRVTSVRRKILHHYWCTTDEAKSQHLRSR